MCGGGDGVSWKRSCARYLIIATYTLILVSLPLFALELVRRGADEHQIASAIAFVFVCLAVPISVHDIVQHLLHYRHPALQRYVIRIIWMVPVYGVESFLSLFFTEVALYVETVRDMYEAFVIYSFLQFLLGYAGSEAGLADRLRHKPTTVGRHLPPCSWCLRDWRLGRDYVQRCKEGVLQYVVTKLACTVAVVLLEHWGVYAEGSLDPRRGYLWVTLVSNFSQIWAIYCLVLFYQSAREELAGVHPLPKFVVIKAVVFFSWWQSVAIAVAAELGYIQGSGGFSRLQVAKALQNFLICVEMLAAAIAHRYTFSYKDFDVDESESVVAEPVVRPSPPRKLKLGADSHDRQDLGSHDRQDLGSHDRQDLGSFPTSANSANSGSSGSSGIGSSSSISSFSKSDTSNGVLAGSLAAKKPLGSGGEGGGAGALLSTDVTAADLELDLSDAPGGSGGSGGLGGSAGAAVLATIRGDEEQGGGVVGVVAGVGAGAAASTSAATLHAGSGGAGSGGGGSGGGGSHVAETPARRTRTILSAIVESALPLDVVREVGSSVMRRGGRAGSGDDEELLPHQVAARGRQSGGLGVLIPGRRGAADVHDSGGRVRFSHRAGLSGMQIQLTATPVNDRQASPPGAAGVRPPYLATTSTTVSDPGSM